MTNKIQNIPDGWEIKKFDKCFSFLRTSSYSRAETTEKGYAHYIHYGDIHCKYNRYAKPDDINIFVSQEQAAKSDKLQNGDLILLDASEDYDGATKCVELRGITNEHIVSGLHTIALRDKGGNFSPLFSAYLTSIPFIKEEFIRQISGVKVYGISKTNLSKINLIIPSLSEQKRIAEVLGVWDEGIEDISNVIALKEQQKKGLMQRLLTGKTRLHGFTEPWEEASLQYLGQITSAGVDKNIVEGEKKVVLLNYMDIYKKDFIYGRDISQIVTAPDRQIKNCTVLRGDIFFTPSSETRDDIAHSAVIMENIPGAVYSYHVIRLRPTMDKIALSFGAYAFKTDRFYKQAYCLCEGSGQRYVLSQNYFRNMTILIPTDINEQKAIAQVLSEADNEISLLKQKLELFKQQKKWLMQQLLTGKKRLTIEGN